MVLLESDVAVSVAVAVGDVADELVSKIKKKAEIINVALILMRIQVWAL